MTYLKMWHILGFGIYLYIIFSHTTHNIQNTTKQQTHTRHLKVQSKGSRRGKDNKNTKVTPLYNHVCPTKNTAKHQWSKAWPHRLAPLYIHMTLFAGGYGSNMFFYTCGVNQFWIIVVFTAVKHSLLHWTNTKTRIIFEKTQTWVNRPINSQ